MVNGLGTLLVKQKISYCKQTADGLSTTLMYSALAQAVCSDTFCLKTETAKECPLLQEKSGLQLCLCRPNHLLGRKIKLKPTQHRSAKKEIDLEKLGRSFSKVPFILWSLSHKARTSNMPNLAIFELHLALFLYNWHCF